MELFEQAAKAPAKAVKPPLADRMRPVTLEEFVGQAHLLGTNGVLSLAIQQDAIPSAIFWGPPGTGKTSLAHLIARHTCAHFISFSAVLAGVAEIRQVIKEAHQQRRLHGRRTILLVDEIHRFNKAQQDAFLPHVEGGTITLIGATTENPSFEVISALRSRVQVFTFSPLTPEELGQILTRALTDRERGLGELGLQLEQEAFDHLIRFANGDARVALNTLELAALQVPARESGSPPLITLRAVQEAARQKVLPYDKGAEQHYNLISALHKSLRGSDPDASLYWLARMLAGGEDPLYIARRMVRFASEDIGNADPQALQVAVAAMQAFHFVGQPEGELALAQAAIYLATAPKSNALYAAYLKVQEDLQAEEAQPVPLHLRNAPTPLMRQLGYGADYRYPHDAPEGVVAQQYLPDNLQGRVYYRPTDQGFERAIKERLEAWKRIKEAQR